MFLKYVLVGKCIIKVIVLKLFSIVDLRRKNRVCVFKSKREVSSDFLDWKGRGAMNYTGGSIKQRPEKGDVLWSGY